MPPVTPQQFANQLLGEFKNSVIRMLNETADDFDERELTDDQKRIYNEFTGTFGNKVLSMNITMETQDNGTSKNG